MNYLAIFLSAVAILILAGLWYGVFFVKPWMRMMNITEEDSKNMSPMTYVYEFVSSAVMYAVLFFVLDKMSDGTLL